MIKIPSSIRRSSWTAVCVSIALIASPLAMLGQSSQAQASSPPHAFRQDLAVTFLADRTNPVHLPNQWLMGGSAELGVSAWRGLGLAVRVTGMTTSSLGTQGVPLNMVVTTLGPRYRLTHSLRSGHLISIYGEGLIGEADAFKGLFPTPQGAIDSSNSFAVQVGGGLDYSLTSRFGLRAVEASWMRTQFVNGGTDVQNHLQLGSGIYLRF